MKRTPYIHVVGAEAGFCSSFEPRLFLRVDARLFDRASRANPTEFRPSLAGARSPYCASSPSLPFCCFSPLRKHGNSRCGQPVR